MTAAQLIKELKKLPPKQRILMSSDAEGNSYHEIHALAWATNEDVALWPADFEVELTEDDD